MKQQYSINSTSSDASLSAYPIESSNKNEDVVSGDSFNEIYNVLNQMDDLEVHDEEMTNPINSTKDDNSYYSSPHNHSIDFESNISSGITRQVSNISSKHTKSMTWEDSISSKKTPLSKLSQSSSKSSKSSKSSSSRKSSRSNSSYNSSHSKVSNNSVTTESKRGHTPHRLGIQHEIRNENMEEVTPRKISANMSNRSRDSNSSCSKSKYGRGENKTYSPDPSHLQSTQAPKMIQPTPNTNEKNQKPRTQQVSYEDKENHHENRQTPTQNSKHYPKPLQNHDNSQTWAKLSVKIASRVLQESKDEHIAQAAASTLLVSGKKCDQKRMKQTEARNYIAADVSTALLRLGGTQTTASVAALAILETDSPSESWKLPPQTNALPHKSKSEIPQPKLQRKSSQKQSSALETKLVKSLRKAEIEKQALKQRMANFMTISQQQLNEIPVRTSDTGLPSSSLPRHKKRYHDDDSELDHQLAKYDETKTKLLKKLKKYRTAETDQRKKHSDLVKKKAAASKLKSRYEDKLHFLTDQMEELKRTSTHQKIDLMEKTHTTKEKKITLHGRKKIAREEESKHKKMEQELMERIAQVEADKAFMSEEINVFEALIEKKERNAEVAELERHRVEEEIMEKIALAEAEKTIFLEKMHEIQETVEARRFDDERLMSTMAATEADRAAIAKQMQKLAEAESVLKHHEQELRKRIASAKTNLLIKRMHATTHPSDRKTQQMLQLDENVTGSNYKDLDLDRILNMKAGSNGILKNTTHPIEDFDEGTIMSNDNTLESHGSNGSHVSNVQEEEKGILLQSIQESINLVKDTGKGIAEKWSDLYSRAACMAPTFMLTDTNKNHGEIYELDSIDDDSQLLYSKEDNDYENDIKGFLGANNPYLNDLGYEDPNYEDMDLDIDFDNDGDNSTIEIRKRDKSSIVSSKDKNRYLSGIMSRMAKQNDNLEELLADVDDLLMDKKKDIIDAPKNQFFMESGATSLRSPHHRSGVNLNYISPTASISRQSSFRHYRVPKTENAYDDYAHISRPMTPQGILKKGSFRHEDREGPNLGTIPSKSKFLKLGKMKFRWRKKAK